MREFQSILARAARKLAAAAMVRSALVGLTAAAIACALVELGRWGVERGLPYLAAVVLAAGVACAIVAAAIPRHIWRLFRRDAGGEEAFTSRLGGAIALAAIAAGAVLMRRQGVGAWILPATLLSAGALLGAAVSLLATARSAARGELMPRTAVYLDREFGLQERAATAQELTARGKSDEPWGRCVCVQALAAMKESRASALPLRVPGGVLGAAGLAVLTCLAMAMLPGAPRPEGREVLAAQAAEALGAMTAREKQQWIQRLNEAAKEAALKPAVEANLVRAAQAAEQADPEALRGALERLSRSGVDLRTVVPGRPASAVEAQTRQGGGGHVANPIEGGNRPASAPEPARADYVRVMNPAYGRAQAAGQAATKASAMLPWRDAWESARARALQAIVAGEVAAPRRQLVRDFFEADGGRPAAGGGA